MSKTDRDALSLGINPSLTEIITGQNDDLTDKTVKCRLLGRYIHLLRMKTPNLGGVAVTEMRQDTTGWYEVLAVGPECKYFTPDAIGKAVWLPNNPIGARRIWSWYVGPAERVVHEGWFDEPDGPPLMVVG